MNIIQYWLMKALTGSLILQLSPPRPPYGEYLLRIIMDLLEQFLHWYQGYVTIGIITLALLLAINVTALVVAILFLRHVYKKIVWLPAK